MMKINDFAEYMKKSVNRTTKDDQVLEIAKKKLEVKEYISIKEKRALIDRIINACVLYENGVYKFDSIDKYVYFTMYTIEACTNIELSSDVEDDFDNLSRASLLPIVICAIQKEYDDVNILLQMQCDALLENNSVEVSVSRVAEGVIEFLDSIESTLKDNVDVLSKLKLGDGMDFGKLLGLLNKD